MAGKTRAKGKTGPTRKESEIEGFGLAAPDKPPVASTSGLQVDLDMAEAGPSDRIHGFTRPSKRRKGNQDDDDRETLTNWT